MIVCDKCKKEVYGNDSKVTFRYYERIDLRPVDVVYARDLAYKGPVERCLTIDLCSDCQEKIVKEILGRVPWKFEEKEGEEK